MKNRRALIFVSLVLCHPSVLAESPEQQHFTAIEDIQFSDQSRVAFDRSGGLVTHRHLANGVLMAEHNGSLGNVTVARLVADGTMETLCTNDEAFARAWMAGKTLTPPSTSLELDEGRD